MTIDCTHTTLSFRENTTTVRAQPTHPGRNICHSSHQYCLEGVRSYDDMHLKVGATKTDKRHLLGAWHNNLGFAQYDCHLLEELGVIAVVQRHGLPGTGLLHHRIVSQLRRHVLQCRLGRCGAVRVRQKENQSGSTQTRNGGG